jgi:hypothetical protein
MAPSSDTAGLLKEAQSQAKTAPSKAESLYREVLSKGPGSNEASSRDYESALLGLGELYRDQRKPNELAELLKTSRSAFSSFAKAKSAKLGMLPYLEYALLLLN